MSKKSFPSVTSQDEAWDDELNDIVTILEDQPFPLTNYATIAALNSGAPSNQNDDGIALVDVDDDVDFTDEIIVVSSVADAAYKKLAWQSTEVPELTDNTGGSDSDTLAAPTVLTDSPADADALRDELANTVLPEIYDYVASMTDQINGILAAMKNTGAMASA